MPKKPLPTDEDEAQSKRFVEFAKERAAAGELNLTEAESEMDRLLRSGANKRGHEFAKRKTSTEDPEL